MKKGMLMLALVLFVGGFALAGNGAVKMDLYAAGTDVVAGWTIANTTADGRLLVNVKVNAGEEGVYDVYLPGDLGKPTYVAGQIVVSKKGKGQASFSVDLPEDLLLEDFIALRVNLKQGVDSIYATGGPGVFFDVPVK